MKVKLADVENRVHLDHLDNVDTAEIATIIVAAKKMREALTYYAAQGYINARECLEDVGETLE